MYQKETLEILRDMSTSAYEARDKARLAAENARRALAYAGEAANEASHAANILGQYERVLEQACLLDLRTARQDPIKGLAQLGMAVAMVAAFHEGFEEGVVEGYGEDFEVFTS